MSGEPTAPEQTTLPDYNIKEAAHAGARYLDEKHPTWFRYVDPDVLDMQDCLLCTLGQIGSSPLEEANTEMFEPDYGALAVQWGLRISGTTMADYINTPYDPNRVDVWTLGFCLPWALDKLPPSESDTLWGVLEDAWREEINARMAL